MICVFSYFERSYSHTEKRGIVGHNDILYTNEEGQECLIPITSYFLVHLVSESDEYFIASVTSKI